MGGSDARLGASGASSAIEPSAIAASAAVSSDVPAQPMVAYALPTNAPPTIYAEITARP